MLPHGASSKEKAILAIHPRSSGRGILAFSRNDPSSADCLPTFQLLLFYEFMVQIDVSLDVTLLPVFALNQLQTVSYQRLPQ